jgi:uncharacterized protein
MINKPDSEGQKLPQSPKSNSEALSETERTSRNWAMFCHLAALIGIGLSIGTTFIIPLGFVGPLLVWLIKKNEYPAADEHGMEATNFQITMAGLQIVFLLIPIIGWLLLPFLVLLNIGITIFAAVKASHGEPYRYPLSLRLLN